MRVDIRKTYTKNLKGVRLKVMRLKAGDIVPLVAQLYDGATNQYIRVTVKDEAGATVSGSPVTLTHIANGMYRAASLAMPTDVEFITAQYLVYSDAGYTTISSYAEFVEVWSLDENTSTSSSGGNGPNLEAVIYGSKLEAKIEEDET